MQETDPRYVTQDQCEDRRNQILSENAKQTRDIAKLYGEIKALNQNVTNLVEQNKWLMGIVAAAFGGMFIYLICK